MWVWAALLIFLYAGDTNLGVTLYGSQISSGTWEIFTSVGFVACFCQNWHGPICNFSFTELLFSIEVFIKKFLSSSSWWFYDWLQWCLLATWLKMIIPHCSFVQRFPDCCVYPDEAKSSHFTSTPCTTFCTHFVLKRVLQSHTKGIRPFPRVLFWGVQNPPQGSWVVLPHIPKAPTSLGLPFPELWCARACKGWRPVEFTLLSDTGFQSQVQPVSSGTAGDDDKWVTCS